MESNSAQDYSSVPSYILAIGIVFLVISVYLSYAKKSGSNHAISSGFLLLFFSIVLFASSSINIVGEIKIKIGELEATIKESQRATEEAKATIEQLRKVALAYAEPTFIQLFLTGNWMNNISIKGKVELRSRVAESLKDLGIGDTQINEAATSLDKQIIYAHKYKFFNSLSDETKSHLPKKVENYLEDNFTVEMTPDLNLQLSLESKEWLEDWEFFVKNKQLRRPDLYDH